MCNFRRGRQVGKPLSLDDFGQLRADEKRLIKMRFEVVTNNVMILVIINTKKGRSFDSIHQSLS